MYTADINEIITHYNSECIEFIREHLDKALEPLILNGKWPSKLPKAFVIDQIKVRKKLRSKVPEWAHNYQLILPPEHNFQQSSSQWTASYKADLSDCDVVLDGTGGMGVDSYYFSCLGKKVFYVEKNSFLCAIATFNFKQLGVDIEVINAGVEEVLSSKSGTYAALQDRLKSARSLLYLDPSRKVNHQKIYDLSDAEPRVNELWPYLRSFFHELLIKASPMANIEESTIEGVHASRVQAVSINNELKELLYEYKFEDSENSKQQLMAVDIQKNNHEPGHVCSLEYSQDLGLSLGDIHHSYPDTNTLEGNAGFMVEDEPRSGFLYDPLVAVKKLDLMDELIKMYPVTKMHPSTHIYYSKTYLSDFPGRIFTLVDGFSPNNKAVKKWLSKEGVACINVWAHNYPESTSTLKKRFRLEDGGSRFMIFTKTHHGRHWLWIADLETKPNASP